MDTATGRQSAPSVVTFFCVDCGKTANTNDFIPRGIIFCVDDNHRCRSHADRFNALISYQESMGLDMGIALSAIIELKSRLVGCPLMSEESAYGCMDKPMFARCKMCLAETARLAVVD